MTKTFLHVGCGNMTKEYTTPAFNTDEWKEVRADINEDVKPDIIASMTDMSSIEDNSFDAIYSSHNIEHLFPHEVPLAIKEFLRVLNKDGYLIITCPDLRSVCKQVANNNLTGILYQSGAGPISALDILYGLRPSLQDGNHYMAHKCGFTADVLRESLVHFGFGRAVIATIPQRYVLWGIATKNSEADSDFLFNTLKSHTTLLENAKLAKS